MHYRLINSDAVQGLKTLAPESVHCCITSPPYFGLRDYGVVGQIGIERTPEEYVTRLVEVFGEVRRVLRNEGTLWLNLGDSYATGAGKGGACPGGGKQGEGWTGPTTQANRLPLPGLKPKDLIGIPWMVAFALRADGWYLRSDIIWAKPNPMPESVTDRPTKAHEYLFLLANSERYYYDSNAIKEPAIYFDDDRKARANPENKEFASPLTARMNPHGSDKQRGHGRRHAGFNDRWDAMEKTEQCSGMRNKRSVWTIATQPFPEAHFATFPEALVEPCVLAGCPEGETVIDPFAGSGTVGVVALKHGRNFIGTELNPEYITMQRRRLSLVAPMFHEEVA